MGAIHRCPNSPVRLALGVAAIGAWLASAAPAHAAVTALFEGAGITQGGDPVECTAIPPPPFTFYRYCASDAATERVLSHDGLPPSERAPLDFFLYLPTPATPSAPDGQYPLVVLLHGWPGSKGDFFETEILMTYVAAGYAVLAYDARGFNESCGPDQSEDPACEGQWNHLGDVRYEVRDTQYFAGLLVDERSDEGTPLVDPARIGVAGISYGGAQSATLAALRSRVVDVDGTVHPWTSPAGTPLQIAAAAPTWAWTDFAYAGAPNGRNLDYAVNNAYRGPLGGAPFGVAKLFYILGQYTTGRDSTVYAAPGEDPDINAWNQTGQSSSRRRASASRPTTTSSSS